MIKLTNLNNKSLFKKNFNNLQQNINLFVRNLNL